MKRPISRLLALGILTLVVTAHSTVAAQVAESGIDAQSADNRPQSEEEFYTKSFGVPIDEARRRIGIMEGVGKIKMDLEREFATRMAGLYLDHVPELRMLVRLTGDVAVPTRRLETAAGTLPIVFTTGAKATAEELQAALEAHASTLVTTIPSLQEMYADVRTGEIVLSVHATPLEAEAYAAETQRLQALLGHSFRFEFVSAPLCQLTCPGDPDSQSVQ